MARRIRIYLVGVFLGCVMVYFMLIRNSDRDLLGWLPNKRVLENLNKENILRTEPASCEMNCLQITETEFARIFEEGDVNLSESKPRQDPKVYAVDWTNSREETYRFVFELSAHYSRLIAVHPLDRPDKCDCRAAKD